MSIFLNELRPLKTYRGNFYYPIDLSNRMKNSVVYLMTPNFESTINVINHPYSVNNYRLFKGYYTERIVNLIIDNKLSESGKYLVNGEEVPFSVLHESGRNDFDYNQIAFAINENSVCIDTDKGKERYYYPDFVDDVLDEETVTTRYGTYNFSTIFRNLLYNERMKSQADLFKWYDKVKTQCTAIQYTYSNISMYSNKNLYYDWSFYTEIFNKNNKYASDRGLDIFSAFINRFLFDNRFEKAGYTKKTVVIPIIDWKKQNPYADVFDFRSNVNPLSYIFRKIRTNREELNNWKNIDFLFLGEQGYFVVHDITTVDPQHLPRFMNLVNNIVRGDYHEAETINVDSKQAIMNGLADKLTAGGIKIYNLTGGTKEFTKEELHQMGLLQNPSLTTDNEIKKAALVNKLEKVVAKSTSTDDALKKLDTKPSEDPSYNVSPEEDDEWTKQLLVDLQSSEGVPLNKARKSRMEQTRKDFENKEINGESVSQLMDSFEKDIDIKPKEIDIDNINEGWKDLPFQNFNKEYVEEAMDADIVAQFSHFLHVTHPMNILDLKVENTSTSEDYINTWTCKYEDAETGKRFSMVLDIPRLINNRFMKLRGNEKTLIGQLILLPIIKTDEDTAQIVSNYKKIFIRRKSPGGNSKSSPIVNKLVKAINKYNGRSFKVVEGDNSKISAKYELPIEYMDLGNIYSDIIFKDGSYISFNMDELVKIPFDKETIESEVDRKASTKDLNNKYLGIYVKNGKREAIPNGQAVDQYILQKIISHDDTDKFRELYSKAAIAKRLMYSESSIMNTKMPVIVEVAYSIGLQAALDRAGIKYSFQETRPSSNLKGSYIKFSDGYLLYENKNTADTLYTNGLMQSDFSDFSIKEINSKDMWLAILDEFGGRIKADGLDNFYDLMFDPITAEVCRMLKIPDNYIDGLIYANSLLVDNKYNKHSDITGNRVRTNEIIVGHLYQVLSKAYGDYRNMVKRNKGQVSFSAKRSAVIDSILNNDQTSSDLSTLTPLLEAENAAKVTFKGLSGINSERAFNLEKRSYDDSMLGVLGGNSTGFAGTVGINRQLTINASVKGKRGFIVPKKPSEMDGLNSFTIMEAMSPLSANFDDPMRSAMAFTQTTQHQMLVNNSAPPIITTGAEEALPYMTSNKFSYKFPWKSGKVVDITDEYVIIQDDKTKQKEFVDIRPLIQKNSDGGFFLSIKLEPCVKKGQKLKQNDIVAYDPKSFSRPVGRTKNNDKEIAYNLGTLAKVAIMDTDMGFEDSCVVDSSLSEALTTNYCVQIPVNIDADSNIYNVKNIGDSVLEGEPLLIFQDAFDEKEANELLKSITADNKEELSDLGRKQIRAKCTGIVRDIKIYRTVEMDRLSSTVKSFVNKYDRNINRLKKVMRDNKIDKEYTLPATEKLPAEGKLKQVNGVLIEFYIEVSDKFGIGDKLVFNQALKGVNSYIIPRGKEAYSEYRPEEHINAFLTNSGVMGRMVPSAYLQGLLNKLLVELSRQCQEELGIKPRMMQDMLDNGLNK